MLLLLLLLLFLIYIFYGLFVLLQIILWTLILFISNFLLGINPEYREMKVIRVTSIIVICFILWYNENSELFSMMHFVFPLSISKISYFDDEEIQYVDLEFKTQILKFWESELKDFINGLEDNENYAISIVYLPEFSGLMSEPPRLYLGKSILINKHSSPTLISKYIDERLQFMVKYYNLKTNFLEISQNDSRILIIYQKVGI